MGAGYERDYDHASASLQQGISARQRELNGLVSILARRAFQLQRTSNWLRVATIILSAVLTSKGVIDQISGTNSPSSLIAFTLIGIATTAMIGIEAAFKFEKRAADLNMLAALCQGTVIAVDTEWRKNIGAGEASDLRKAAMELLTLQDTRLTEMHTKAAAAGIPVTLEVRELELPERGETYPA